MNLKSSLLNPDFRTGVIISQVYVKYLFFKREIFLRTTKSKPQGKIFCIGYQKTGTTSLGRALKMLGYKHSSFDHKVYMKLYKRDRNIYKILQDASKFDSFDDLPWSKEDMIPLLDKIFPNSKFIYLYRDEESWKGSLNKWFFKKFGYYPDMEERLMEYRKHKEFVMDYFNDRIDKDLIILNINDPQGFEKLSSFLDKTAPMSYFPHINKTELIRTKFQGSKN